MDKENSVTESEKNAHGHEKKLKMKLLWTFVFIAIAALTIWAITSQKDFSLKSFISFVKGMDPVWFSAAVLAMLGFIVFEALAIKTIIRAFGFKRSLGKCFIYSSSDIYFSAITPSSTGGQPASAYFMMRDGISGSGVTISLIVNLIMYSLSIIVIGTVSFILKPTVFLGLSTLSKVLVAIGSVCLICLVSFFILVIYKGHILHKIGDIGLTFLAKIHLIRSLDKKKAKLASAVNSYNGHVEHLRGKWKTLLAALFFNILQRSSVIAVTLFTYLASGGDPALCVEVWVAQCMVILGTNVLPIPGAMGISDFMLISAFGTIGLESVATNLNLVSRGISFYSCVVICGISLIGRIVVYNILAKKNENK